MPTASEAFPLDAASVGAARRFVRDALAQWGLARHQDDALQVVTELATNSVLHAFTDFVVTLDMVGTGLRIAVADGSDRSPIVRANSSNATTGRGLALVDALSSDWGVESGPGGKTVWCVLTEHEERPKARRTPPPGPARPGRPGRAVRPWQRSSGSPT